MEPVTQTRPEQGAAHDHFGGGVGRFDCRHVGASPFLCDFVHAAPCRWGANPLNMLQFSDS